MFCLDKEYDPLHIDFDMELFRPVVNVHQKEVVQKEVLDKVVLIEPFFICHQKVLDLEYDQFSDHVYIVARALCQQYIF